MPICNEHFWLLEIACFQTIFCLSQIGVCSSHPYRQRSPQLQSEWEWRRWSCWSRRTICRCQILLLWFRLYLGWWRRRASPWNGRFRFLGTRWRRRRWLFLQNFRSGSRPTTPRRPWCLAFLVASPWFHLLLSKHFETFCYSISFYWITACKPCSQAGETFNLVKLSIPTWCY